MIRSFTQIVRDAAGTIKNAAGGSVDSLVAPIHDFVDALEQKATALSLRASVNKQDAQQLLNKASEYEAEATRARRIAASIAKVVK